MTKNMDNQATIGQKIKQFRKRAGISQLELEMRIGTSPGSISRIESGEVNPTKETLVKISKALDLTSTELGHLQNIQIFSAEEILGAINKFSSTLDFDHLLQNTVDTLLDLYPNYNGGVILLRDDKEKHLLRGRAITNLPGMTKVLKLLGASIDSFPIDLSKPNGGFIHKTAKTGLNYASNDLHNFTKGAITEKIIRLAAKILGFKIGITVPIRFNDDVIGVMLYTKKVEEDFTAHEQKILELLSNQIAIAVMNAKYFEEVKFKLQHAKHWEKN